MEHVLGAGFGAESEAFSRASLTYALDVKSFAWALVPRLGKFGRRSTPSWGIFVPPLASCQIRCLILHPYDLVEQPDGSNCAGT